MINLTPTYNDIHNGCMTIVDNINNTISANIDRVVGIARGGCIPGVIISHAMGLPFTPISYSSKSGAGETKASTDTATLPDIDGKTILIVDDICDTSNTLADVVAYYTAHGKNVYTAVLHYKNREKGKHVPDYYWMKIPEDSGWVIYPFEKQ